jgi:hypothetical protein
MRLEITEAQAALVFEAGRVVYRRKTGSLQLSHEAMGQRRTWDEVEAMGYLVDKSIKFYIEI